MNTTDLDLMDLKEDQLPVAEKILNWRKRVGKPGENQETPVFRLHGGAGTGKTKVAAILALSGELGKTAMVTPTGTALQKLESTIRKIDPEQKNMSNIRHMSTIHRAVYRSEPINYDPNQEELFPRGQLQPRACERVRFRNHPVIHENMQEVDTVIVDEAALTEKSLAARLRSLGTPILAVGDPNQINPYEPQDEKPLHEQEENHLTTKERDPNQQPLMGFHDKDHIAQAPAWNKQEPDEGWLTQNLRQQERSPLHVFGQALLEGMSPAEALDLCYRVHERHLVDQQICLRSQNPQGSQRSHGTPLPEDSYDIRILHTNHEVDRWNQNYRARRGSQQALPTPALPPLPLPLPRKGEKLLVRRNTPALGLYNGTHLQVLEDAVPHAHDERLATVRVENPNAPHGMGNPRMINIPFAPLAPKDYGYQSGAHAVQHALHMRHQVPCTWGYALTNHKAQGSEWAHVAVFDPFPHHPNNHQRRWRYTAATRATRKLLWRWR